MQLTNERETYTLAFWRAVDRGAVSLFDGGAVSLYFQGRGRVMYGEPEIQKNPKF